MYQLSAPQEIDEYDLIDPFDILGPLEKSGFWDGVVSAPASLFSVFLLFWIYITFYYHLLNIQVLLVTNFNIFCPPHRKPPNGQKERRLLQS